LFVDPVDLDVGKPKRPVRTAFDDPAAEASAELEREVRAGSRMDQFRPPSEQTDVERACGRLIAGVQLQMHERPWPRPIPVHTRIDPRPTGNPSVLQPWDAGLSPVTDRTQAEP
jgi:hypothetical protein